MSRVAFSDISVGRQVSVVTLYTTEWRVKSVYCVVVVVVEWCVSTL